MGSSRKRNVSITGPDAFTGLEIKEPLQVAAGFFAVKEAMKHGFREMGIFRAMRSFMAINQQGGFDCPSCAWPDPEKPSGIGEYCENGAKALADEATTSKISAAFFRKNSVESLSQRSDFELNHLGRLTEPLVLRKGESYYEPISWEDAFNLVATELHGLDDPNEAIFYTSGRSSNEAAFLYGMFARAYGTNNMPDCSNMCHESSGVALTETLGIGKGSTTLEDLYGADVIIVAGQNPGTNHPRMLSALEKCKRNGGRIISINPLEESGLVRFMNPQSVNGMIGRGEALADLHLQLNINQDIPLVKLILKKLIERDAAEPGILDHDFIRDKTEGYESLVSDLEHYDSLELLQLCGVPEGRIDRAAAWLAEGKKVIVCWAMGLTQHKNAVETIREYINLLLLKGAIGKPHCGTCPVRGHSNVQGDRSVGIMHFVDEALNKRIETHMGFTPPYEEGLDTVGAIKAMKQGKASLFMALGGNFVMAASDTEYTAAAMNRCRLSVQVSTKLNRSHLITGQTALILPTYGRSEKDMNGSKLRYVTVENSMGRVRRSRGLLKPASAGLKSEPEIVAGVAEAYFKGDHPVNWSTLGQDYDLIREKIDLVARGFEKTSERSKGVGYYLPNNSREGNFSHLPNGRARITINSLPQHRLREGELMLMTIRSHDQFNTTIYGLDDRYRGVYNERRVVFMNREDMKSRGLEKETVVRLTSFYNGKIRTATNFKVVPYKIPRGNMAAYFPETNILVPYNHYADYSGTPISKSIRVRVEKSG